MKRSLCPFALFALTVVPDWAAAYHPCYAPPPPCGFYGPVYHRPVVYVPVYEVPLAPPWVQVMPPAVRTAPAEPRPDPVTVKPAPPPAAPTPSAPMTDPTFRPAAGLDLPPPPAAAPPGSKPTDPPVFVMPDLTPRPPAQTPEPPRAVPNAVPSPAPAPAAPLPDLIPPLPTPPAGPTPNTLIPPTAPTLPTGPLSPGGVKEELPPLTLPPESSALPPSKSFASPLAAGPVVKVYPATGGPVGGETRKVGFYNHTGRDITLTVQEKTVTLPKMSYITAQVPPRFQWKYGTTAAETTTVPAGASGLEVVFRAE